MKAIRGRTVVINAMLLPGSRHLRLVIFVTPIEDRLAQAAWDRQVHPTIEQSGRAEVYMKTKCTVNLVAAFWARRVVGVRVSHLIGIFLRHLTAVEEGLS